MTINKLTSTLTPEQQAKIRDLVTPMHLPSGLGSKEAACSIAAINLALTGELTDSIPECMSRVIGKWIIRVQDAMPDSIRNSDEWKNLLPLAAGTGREKEAERRDMIMGWMWGALENLQPLADERGFGKAWATMTAEKSAAAAYAAYAAAAYAAAAYAAYAAAAAAAAYAAYAVAAAVAADAVAAVAADAAAAAYADAKK